MTDMSLTVDGSVYVFAQADLQYRGLCDAGSGSESWTQSSGWNARPVSVAARFVVRLVACALQIDEGDMLSGRRGTAEVARARQIAMYLLHTSLSVSYMDVADMFGRDRTTVSHACRTVEDLRDENFITYSSIVGVSYQDVVLQHCRKAGFVPKVVQEVSHTMTVVAMASAGIGVGIVPAWVVMTPMENVVYRELPKLPKAVSLVVAWREDSMNPFVRDFVKCTLAAVGETGH